MCKLPKKICTAISAAMVISLLIAPSASAKCDSRYLTKDHVSGACASMVLPLVGTCTTLKRASGAFSCSFKNDWPDSTGACSSASHHHLPISSLAYFCKPYRYPFEEKSRKCFEGFSSSDSDVGFDEIYKHGYNCKSKAGYNSVCGKGAIAIARNGDCEKLAGKYPNPEKKYPNKCEVCCLSIESLDYVVPNCRDLKKALGAIKPASGYVLTPFKMP